MALLLKSSVKLAVFITLYLNFPELSILVYSSSFFHCYFSFFLSNPASMIKFTLYIECGLDKGKVGYKNAGTQGDFRQLREAIPTIGTGYYE